jgi:hypothetical protein
MSENTGTAGDEPVNTINEFLVGVRASEIIIGLPPLRPLTRGEALRLAAWLVAVADPFGDEFDKVRRAVLST